MRANCSSSAYSKETAGVLDVCFWRRRLEGLEAEVQTAARHRQRPVVGPLRGDTKRKTRWHSDTLLRPGQREVQAPCINLHGALAREVTQSTSRRVSGATS